MATNATRPRGTRKLNLPACAATLMALFALGHAAPAAGQTPAPTPWVESGNNIHSTNTGNVGVGTQTPAGKLEVQGPDGALVLSQAGLVTKTSVQAGIGKDLHLSANAMFSAGAWNRFDTALPTWNLMLSTNLDYAAVRRVAAGANPIGFTGPGSWTELLVVRSSGNVGIGTSNPTYRLDVRNGQVNASGGLCIAGDCKSSWGEMRQSQWEDAGSSIYYSAGNVGLGVSNPGQRLGVQGMLGIYPTAWAQPAVRGLFVYHTGVGGSIYAYNYPAGTPDPLALSASSINLSTYAGAALTPRLSVTNGGSVGVGTTAPAYRLDVQGGQVNASGGLCIGGDCKTAWSQVGGADKWEAAGSSIYYSAGNVGVGTTVPNSALEVRDANAFAGTSFAGSGTNLGNLVVLSTTAQAADVGAMLSLGGSRGSTGTGVFGGVRGAKENSTDGDHSGYLAFYTLQTGVAFAERVRVTGTGNVGIGTKTPAAKLDVAGSVHASGGLNVGGAITGGSSLNVTGAITGGSIEAKYQDVAEWVPSAQALAAGTVVVLDTERTNQVLASSSPYDTKVAGVVSARPGIALGEAGEGKVLVATTGRVKVRVDATREAIKVGDLLVTGGVEGVAMKSVPLNFGGTPLHRPGTIIGKALEPLEKGVGEILVLLSLQ